jgi:hypothetical protein
VVGFVALDRLSARGAVVAIGAAASVARQAKAEVGCCCCGGGGLSVIIGIVVIIVGCRREA